MSEPQEIWFDPNDRKPFYGDIVEVICERGNILAACYGSVWRDIEEGEDQIYKVTAWKYLDE